MSFDKHAKFACFLKTRRRFVRYVQVIFGKSSSAHYELAQTLSLARPNTQQFDSLAIVVKLTPPHSTVTSKSTKKHTHKIGNGQLHRRSGSFVIHCTFNRT